MREAASIAALVEVAEEAAEQVAEGPRLASLPYLDSIGGDASITAALPAVKALTRRHRAELQARAVLMLPGGTLADRVALVTGGGSGLGRAMALELGRLGATVAVLGRRREPLEETVELLGAGCAVPADVREPEGVAAAFDAAEEQLGPIARRS